MAQSFGTARDTKYPTQRFYVGDICAIVHWTDDPRMDSCAIRTFEPIGDRVVVGGLRVHRRLCDVALL